MENLTQKLKILGLDDKDIAVYLAILTLGKSTITDISRKSAIKRTTIYSYLDNLLKFGLIFKTVDKKRIYYCPENPDKIKSVLEKQKTEIDEKKEKINLVIPELENLYSSSFNRPRISFYESKEGLREIYWQMLDTHKKVYSIFSPDNFFQIFSLTENHKLMMTLYNNGGAMHSLVEKSDKPHEVIKKDEYKKFVKSKNLPNGFHFKTDLFINKFWELLTQKDFVGLLSPKAGGLFAERLKILQAIHGDLITSKKISRTVQGLAAARAMRPPR